ncbi:hypothetical protein BH11PSE11_BH11PSE11_22450 [soil metagenome]
MSSPIHLPNNVIEALRRNNTIEAIKLLRQASGLGLAEAKGMIDAYRRAAANSSTGDSYASAAAISATTHATASRSAAGATPDFQADLKADSQADALRALVIQALGKGNKIEAIRLTRELTGKGLKEAKEEVDAMEAARPISALTANGLAPGEVPRTSGSGWWIVVIAIIALIFYYGFNEAT